jgi:hypothetical protein
MSLLSGLKGLVIQEDEPTVKPSTPQAAPAAAPVGGFPTASLSAYGAAPVSPSAGTVATANSVLDRTAVEAKIEAVIQAQPSFAPYAQFQKVLASLAAVIPDEATRYKAAAASSSLLKADLLAAVDVKGPITGETQNFNNSFIGNATVAIQNLTAEKEAAEKSIADLTAQLQVLTQKRTDLANEIVNKTGEMQKASIDFNSVAQMVQARYADISNKLNQYLGA